MKANDHLSRRQFVAAASAGLVLANAADAAPDKPAPAESLGKLAIEGGEKSVKVPAAHAAALGRARAPPTRDDAAAKLALLLARAADAPLDRALPGHLPAEICTDLLVGHRGAAHRGWGGRHRARRRSNHFSGDRHRQRDRRALPAGRARLRRSRPRQLQSRRGRRQSPHHAQDEGHHRGPPDRQPLRSSRAERLGRRAQVDFDRGLCPGVGRTVSRQADRQRRAHRLFLAARFQAHHLRRRRRGRQQRRALRQALAALRRQGRRPAQLGRRAGVRHQLPHERAAGRRRRCAVAAARGHRLAARPAGKPAHRENWQTAWHHRRTRSTPRTARSTGSTCSALPTARSAAGERSSCGRLRPKVRR